MAQRRHNAQLWVGSAILVCVAGLVVVLASRNGFAERRDAAFDGACRALVAALAGDASALSAARAGFRGAVGRIFSDRTPYYALHVLDELERRRARGTAAPLATLPAPLAGASVAAREEGILAAFLRADFAGAIALARSQESPSAHYGVRLAEALLRVSGAPVLHSPLPRRPQ